MYIATVFYIVKFKLSFRRHAEFSVNPVVILYFNVKYFQAGTGTYGFLMFR